MLLNYGNLMYQRERAKSSSHVSIMSRKAKRKIQEIETTVSESGNGAHVFVKEWHGKTVKVVLLD